jgi:hypothetical protein
MVKMKKLRTLLTLSILICLIYNANAGINELVEYEVYYNDQTATVFDADLKVGEPATIKAVVYLKKMLMFQLVLQLQVLDLMTQINLIK